MTSNAIANHIQLLWFHYVLFSTSASRLRSERYPAKRSNRAQHQEIPGRFNCGNFTAHTSWLQVDQCFEFWEWLETTKIPPQNMNAAPWPSSWKHQTQHHVSQNSAKAVKNVWWKVSVLANLLEIFIDDRNCLSAAFINFQRCRTSYIGSTCHFIIDFFWGNVRLRPRGYQFHCLGQKYGELENAQFAVDEKSIVLSKAPMAPRKSATIVNAPMQAPPKAAAVGM